MCRISGIVSDDESIIRQSLVRMNSAMAHGGPDGEGLFVDHNIGFGHRRLAIIDLSSSGHQPMISRDERFVITFNGEIYNYQILREELIERGVTFRTATDTEVILASFAAWGPRAFDRFDGIFAFALLDRATHKLYLVRDHLGVKPLYYCVSDRRLIFASEVKAFLAQDPSWKNNHDWKILFLAFGSIPFPHTTLENVVQLGAGAYMEYDLVNHDNKISIYRQVPASPFIRDQREALTISRNAVEKALVKNLVADAPLGVFLSGGIDSSLLTLLADRLRKRVKTVSVNFEEAAFDERPYQDIVLERARHVHHHSYMVTEANFWENLDDIWQAMDQPSADGVNAYFVSKYAARDGLKAVLSGLGADEVFGGYRSFGRVKWISRLRALPAKGIIASLLGSWSERFKRIAFLNIKGAVGDYLFLRGIHTPDSIARILGCSKLDVWRALNKVRLEMPDKLDAVEYATFLEMKMYMSNQLLKDMDYMSMWHGLEARVPFLDVRLVDQIASIDPSIRLEDRVPKFLITEPFRDLLPDAVIFRRKSGFTFPFPVWMKNSLSRFGALMPEGEEVGRIVHKFEAGKVHWSKCWSLAVLNNFNTRQRKAVNEPTANYYRTG